MKELYFAEKTRYENGMEYVRCGRSGVLLPKTNHINKRDIISSPAAIPSIVFLFFTAILLLYLNFFIGSIPTVLEPQPLRRIFPDHTLQYPRHFHRHII